MKNFALIKNSLPVQTATPALDSDYQDGQEFDGGVWREFSLNITHSEILLGWYYLGHWKKLPDHPGEFHTWDMDMEAWVFDLPSAIQAKSAEISIACEQQILSGFKSSALGEEYHYPSDLTDQANLTASVMRSMLPDAAVNFPFRCSDLNRVWEFRPHSASQIQQVGREGYEVILAARERNSLLQASISQAATLEEIQIIAW